MPARVTALELFQPKPTASSLFGTATAWSGVDNPHCTTVILKRTMWLLSPACAQAKRVAARAALLRHAIFRSLIVARRLFFFFFFRGKISMKPKEQKTFLVLLTAARQLEAKAPWP